MQKEEVKRLLAANSSRLSLQSGAGTSEVWPHFARVIIDGVLAHFVVCEGCKVVLKWKAKDGTSGLKAHMQSCKRGKSDGVRKLTNCSGVSTGRTTASLSVSDRNDVTKAVVRFCARDMRPFNTVEGKEQFV